MRSLVPGGYVTAFVARRAEVRHAAVPGGIALAVGLAMTLAMHGGGGRDPQMPGWYTAVTLAYVVPAAVLGGFLRAVPRRGSSASVK